MSTIIPDHWYIPPPVAAARVRGPAGGDDRLARIAAMDEERMADSLAFLAGYAPGVLDAILVASERCVDDLLPPDADALEPYCVQCGVKAGIFVARGEDWRHYTGDPENRSARPVDADHAPVIGWRPADGTAFVAI
jgi:hypothetical protein